MITASGARRWPGALLLVLLLSACAAPLQSTAWRQTPPADLRQPVELSTVPFFPQTPFQCGPAALATLLVWSGVEVTPEDIVPQVYLPERQGSLQSELLAASRRHGRVPYVLARDLDALLREVAAGHPVMVLQNLGLSWYPRWHYAVVVGFDMARGEVVLRSGGEARHRLSLATFERTWQRGGAWAAVVLPPSRLPATADELSYVRTVSVLEKLDEGRTAGAAYESATRRWPASIAAWFGLGNSAYAQGRYVEAALAYRRILALEPTHGPALNNLANTLLQQGELIEAERYVLAALAADANQVAYADTLREIRARMAARSVAQ